MSLSENIRKFRTEKNMTQEQLANLLGVSSQAVSKWETSETYPDGSLILLLANTLEVSLDSLFGNEKVYKPDVTTSMIRLVRREKYESKFELVRNLCWNIEKGLFGSSVGESYESSAPTNNESYILIDYGFTNISNGDAPYFSVFPEPECGWKKTIGDGEDMRKIFECLSSPETMKAVLFIHSKEAYYFFEDAHLARECSIPDEKMPDVLGSLLSLKLIAKFDVNIDGQTVSLYKTFPSHRMIALLLFAKNLNYAGSYSYQADNRCEKPYLI